MYGRQSEIQRIQSKLQRIGKTNPHRHTSEKPFISTRDRYSTPAGKQALRTMGKVAEGEPTTDTAILFPQSSSSRPTSIGASWPNLMSKIDSEASQKSHQLAHTLRQQSYTARSDRSAVDSRQVKANWNHGNHSDTGYPHPPETRSPGPAPWRPRSRFSVTQGVIWLAVAAIVRVVIDRLLVTFPGLWVVIAALVLTPVVVALYQTAINPQSTVHSGRRLLVIMMGLLIGGQF
ncbi:MAG: hypothetical protein AAGD25_14285 [Cyanobacteria bacterium P01_F01_bin.150]